VVVAGQWWPGNRNDVIVARATIAHLLSTGRENLGYRGYRGITSITTPRRDETTPIIRDDHYRVHRRIRIRVETVIARSTTGKYCGNAAAATTPSTTAPASSPDPGTSKPTINLRAD
jgi:hypothetical protein